MKNSKPVVIHWFRRDLRLRDNKGLYHALNSGFQVLPLFIFDDEILESLPKKDHRVSFIHKTLHRMHKELQEQGRGLVVKRGKPLEVLKSLCSDFDVKAVYCNRDHEPYGISRDKEVYGMLKDLGIDFYAYLDHLIFDQNDVQTAEGKPYQVYTPYSRAWKALLKESHMKAFPSEKKTDSFFNLPGIHFPAIDEIGFDHAGLEAPPLKLDEENIRNYDKTRDFPAVEGTTRIGVHLRFGTLSIRDAVKKALLWNDTFLNELIWREFYAVILWNAPHIVDRSYKPAYDRIEWRNNEEEFERWKVGKTGYPMVDAGMRQLNETGYMHNRVRMITASFLTKHLLIDWRWGEAYFAEKLFDYELSSNNGGWQWSAGTGADAAPYFRIFNPTAQQKKFDPDQKYIRKWIPELETADYPEPVVDHRQARERCLKTYKQALEP